MQREGMSLDWALRSHGNDKVSRGAAGPGTGAAATVITQPGTPTSEPCKVTIPMVSSSDGTTTGEVLRTTGGDLNAYRQRILDEALKDPEYQRKVIEAARGQAQASGRMVERPVKSSVASSPSLGDIGAGGGDATSRRALRRGVIPGRSQRKAALANH